MVAKALPANRRVVSREAASGELLPSVAGRVLLCLL